MSSDRIRPLLNALADGELSPWTAARVRLHLKTCTGCRAEYAAIQSLGAEAHAWRDVAHAPGTLEGRVIGALAQTTTGQLPVPSVAVIKIPQRRLAAWKPLTALVAGAVVFAAVVLLSPGSPTRPLSAFAAVERKMWSVRNVHWTETLTIYGAGGQVIQHSTRQKWVLTDPPKIATTFFPDPTFPHSTNGQLLETQSRALSHYRDANGDRYEITSRADKNRSMSQKVSDEIGRLMSPPLHLSHSHTFFTRSGDQTTPQKQERTLLDGKSVWKFSLSDHGKMPFPNDGLTKVTVPTIGTCTWWVDVKTLRVVQLEDRTVTESGQPLALSTYTDIHYDQTPPHTLFDENPPPGAKVYLK